ncbi:nuclear transport factor 2 family protein [Aestuariivivens sp. NBU2969]|uniref:nuclear transport factor 2 family protein n=1 Tax=Aestuariivivens sp. NBU2969 TaxID=2873267 RepID=UPI001CBF5755|nr:nuclear transport factor 2 family protein [Aestuariivivens sp. NBU2969]
MQRVLVYLTLVITTSLFGQGDDTLDIRKAVDTFFEGFHKGDTTLMKSVMMDKVLLQTAFRNKEGKDVLRNDGDISKLLETISNRPADQKWDERLLDYSIQVDGNMANAWTPYEFWFNGEFSHCGVNSFQLFKDGDQWKIIYLIDTRRRKGCLQE